MFRRMICALILIMLTVISAAAETDRVEYVYKKREQTGFRTETETAAARSQNSFDLLEQISAEEGHIKMTEDVVKTSSVESKTAADVTPYVETNVDKTDKAEKKDAETTAVVSSPEEERSSEREKQKERTEKAEREAPAAQTAEHTHVWKTEIIFHEAVTHTVHHEEITEQRWVSVPETVFTYVCDGCGKEFLTQAEAYAHEDDTYQKAIETGDFSGVHTGHTTVQNTVDRGYYETVTVQEAWDETVTDSPSREEKRTFCEVCGAEG